MYTFFVSLSSVDNIKTFSDAASNCTREVDVRAGRYLVNAKSIMGLFSLDLAKPVQVEVLGSEEEGTAFKSTVAPFVVEVGA